jgi:hypothetical protein
MSRFTGKGGEILIGDVIMDFDDWVIKTYDWKIGDTVVWDGTFGIDRKLENEELLRLSKARIRRQDVLLIFYIGESQRWKGWARLISEEDMENEGITVPPKFPSAYVTFYFRGTTKLVGEITEK